VSRAAAGLAYEQFIRDEVKKRAFVRSIEIIGEAAKKVPEEVRADRRSTGGKSLGCEID
jgi:uncharacterized protein with HEPN domain